MSIRTKMALNVAPLTLRLALGLTFIWAGFGKVAYRMDVAPADQAILAQWGQIDATGIPAPAPTQPEAEPETQPESQSPTETPVEPDASPTIPDEVKEILPDALQNPDALPDEIPDEIKDTIDEPAPTTPEPPAAGDGGGGGGSLPVSFASQSESPVQVKRVLGIALMIHHAANPGVDDQGQAKLPLWPSALAKGSIPVILAWAVAVLELVCGAAMLFGFFTRIAALPIATIMAVALWLTQIGPAIQSGSALLGFLPPDPFGMTPGGGYTYVPLILQFTLLMAAKAVFLIGPGALSIDRLIFGAPSGSNIDDGRQVEFVPIGD